MRFQIIKYSKDLLHLNQKDKWYMIKPKSILPHLRRKHFEFFTRRCIIITLWGISSVDRAPDFGSGCQEFKSSMPRQRDLWSLFLRSD